MELIWLLKEPVAEAAASLGVRGNDSRLAMHATEPRNWLQSLSTAG